MKTPIMIFLAVVLLLFFNISNISAATITVDNKYPYAGDYQTLQEAHDAASAGDTIFVSPSLVPYVGIIVTKRLIFFGVGFDITENIGEPFTPTTSISGIMRFRSGSEGSWLEGFDGRFDTYAETENITIKRNNLMYIVINNGVSGTSIFQNKIHPDNNRSWAISSSSGATNTLISNNIIITDAAQGIAGGSNLLIFNNVIKC